MRSTPRLDKTLAFVIAAAIVAAACSSADDAIDAGPALTADRASETTLRSEAPVATTERAPDVSEDPPTTLTDSEGLARSAPGLDTAGDSLFPGIGNGGYDIESYRISIDAADQTAFTIETVIALTATSDLTTFNLDLVGMEVVSVSVDAATATFDRDGRELIITPTSPLASGDRSTVIVTTNGRPEPTPDPASLESAAGWINESWGSYVASEPTGAATWFASNDHPTDKATFDIFVTVASGQIGAGPGILVDETANVDGTTTFHWQSDDPMATYLASVVIGDFVIDTVETATGTVLRDVYPTSRADEIRTAMAGKHEAMLELFVEIFGPYPFDSYGVVGVPENLGYALENQTLSLFSADDLATDELFIDLILAHELAHQWFGNHVSPADWDDIWLNEGFATWAHLYWVAQQIETNPFDSVYADAQAIQLGPIKGLRPDELFALRVYDRGALTLEAIRRTIGDEAFFDLLRAWVERHGGGSATTQDFLNLVTEQHGTDVEAIAQSWIFDDAVPELPAG